ncbi:MAG: DUF6328 family protein [Nocardioides sp.]|uniref:DUF6328 family protein n=1 Tax=Nocardioides nematodiphilus TaxID=2849669 RepID=UPI001CD9D1CC|nr:DUF6328 family protein [Nocardioides nematodiphilus]MCA1983470.1 DUF6328 family protein [Nocardioides nematodiphilus]
MEESSTPRHDRDETRAERMDRLFGDLLQELRVMQTGAQLTSGFLLTLPFQTRFTDLDGFQRGLYLALVIISLLTTALVMTAVAVHQRLSGQQVKDRVVAVGRTLLAGVLMTLALLVTGIAVFVVDVVEQRGWALATGGLMAVVLIGLLIALPRYLLVGIRRR